MEFLIKNIDIYIMNIILGFTFLKTFQFVALKKIDCSLIPSFIIGYIYMKLCNIIPWHITNEIDMIGIFISAIILAYLLGRIYISNSHLRIILEKFHINQTPNKYIWNDLFGKYSIQLIIKYDNAIYDGFVYLIESESNSPHIILGSYIKYDMNGNIIMDNSNNNEQIIVLDLSKAEYVEIKYFSEDKMCESIQNMCESRKIMYPKS